MLFENYSFSLKLVFFMFLEKKILRTKSKLNFLNLTIKQQKYLYCFLIKTVISLQSTCKYIKWQMKIVYNELNLEMVTFTKFELVVVLLIIYF